MLAVDAGEVGRFALEEAVARRAETLPDGIRMAARHGADLLPAGLQGYQFVGGLLPLLAVLQRLGLGAYLILELEVVLHLGLHAGEELPLALEEAVARRAEALVDTVVVLLRGETDGLPRLLNLQQTLVGAVPLLEGRQRLAHQLLGRHAEPLLQFEVVHLFGLQRLEVLLVLLVDAARSLLETLPERLLVFVGHGARFAPLVVELLQLVERLDNRRLEHQRLGLLAEGNLLLVVLLQVEVTQLLVDFDEVVEILDMEVVGLPQVLDLLLGHRSGLLPALLQLAEAVEGMIERLVGIDQRLELLDDAELRLQVLLLLLLEVGQEGVAARTVFADEVLEPRLRTVGRRRKLLLLAAGLDEGLARRFDLGAAYFVESHLNRLDVAAERLHGLLFEHPGEEVEQFLLAPADIAVRRSGLKRLGIPLGKRLLAERQVGIFGRERSLFIGEIHRFVLRGRHRLLRHGGGRRRLVGRCRSGGGDVFGVHDGSDTLHIFSNLADLLLGSRKIRILSSHFYQAF